MRAVNLIPPEQRSSGVGAGRSQGGAYAVLALIGGLAILAFLYGHAEHQISSRTAQARTLSAEAQRAQAQAGQLAPYTSFVSLREQRTQEVSTLVDSRFDWAHAVHEFGRVLPPGVSLTSLAGTIGATASASGAPAAASGSPGSGSGTPSAAASSTPSATAPGAASSSGSGTAGASAVASATPPGSVPSFLMSGCAVSQPVVALMLERLRLIDGVSSVTLQSSTKTGAGSGGAASAGSAGSGGCPAQDPQFSVQIAFQALPSAAAAAHAVPTANTTTKAGSR